MRQEILQAIEPIIFGNHRASYAIRAEFEEAFAQATEQSYAVGVHSATVALYIALKAFGVEPGDEVITIANSDISTTGVISQCGATPILCDIRKNDYTIDIDQIEQLITPRTRAILPVDIHGHPADVKGLRSLADQYGLKILEDAALATGTRDYGKHVGSYADAAVFSFAPFKPLGSVGNGAMITTNDAELNHKLRLLVGYGHDPNFSYATLGHQQYIDEGYNVPLDGLEAALLKVKLPHIHTWTKQRQQIAQAYHDGLADLDIALPSFRPESEPTFRSYVICVDDQADLHRHLLDAGIEVVLHYTPPIYQHPVYSGELPNSKQLPVTDWLASHLVNLPVTPELTAEDTDYVVDVIRTWIKNKRP